MIRVAAVVCKLVHSQRRESFAAEVDSISANDPKIPEREAVKQVLVFPPKLKAIWVEALQRPEIDLQRQSAETIARAHKLGMTDLADVVPLLIERLEAADSKPIVRYAAARTLIVLNAREAAPVLMKHAQTGGFDMAQLVEPACARWEVREDVRRVDRPPGECEVAAPELVLAMQAADAAGIADAARRWRLALDAAGHPTDLRLQAGEPWASSKRQGEKDARGLAGEKGAARQVAGGCIAPASPQRPGRQRKSSHTW